MRSRTAAARWPAALAAALLAACGASGPAPAVPRPEGRPSLVIVLIDTLRADHTSLHGYARDTTPFLTELARECVVFARAYAPASWTRASVASLLTGRIPEAHGCEGRDGRLAESLTTLTEVLQAAGYATVGLTANGNVLGTFGFAQGFDRYEFVKDFPDHPYADVARMQPVLDAALADLGDGPAFLYLHYVDPHDPYHPHAGFDYDPAYAGPMDGSRAALEPWQARRPAPPELQRGVDLYDGEVAWFDHHLRAVFGSLERAGLLQSAWIVVTSDHGEGLWTHRTQGHGQEVFEEQIRVPLLLRPPGGLARHAWLDAPISLVDVAPTLLDLLGARAQPDMPGRSWAPFLWGEGAAPVRPIVADEQLDGADLHAVVDGDSKLIVDRRRGQALVYDLAADPGERGGSPVGGPDAGRRLWALLDAALAEAARIRPADLGEGAPLDPEQVRILQAMGYLQGPGAGDPGATGEPDGDAGPAGRDDDGSR